MAERIGVFGGTFDPPHVAHLIAAQEVYEQLGLDRLLLVPAAVPPHKQEEAVTPGPLRLAMLEAAVGEDERFQVSGLELERDGPSYTVDTLRALRGEHPAAELFLAVGADQMAVFGSWKDPDEIAELATLAVFARAGKRPEQADDWPAEVVDVPELEISSTAVRERVRAGKSIRYLVPEGVELIIRWEGLYAPGG